LNDILSRRGILKYPACKAIHGISMARPEELECVLIAACGARDTLLFRIHDSVLPRESEKIRVGGFFLSDAGPLLHKSVGRDWMLV
jgi:hypothetical protein